MSADVFGITEGRWTFASEITDQPRALKALVRNFNNHFGEDEKHTYYILSGSKGYRLTKDRHEIFEAIGREERITKTRWRQAYCRKRAAIQYFSTDERLSV